MDKLTPEQHKILDDMIGLDLWTKKVETPNLLQRIGRIFYREPDQIIPKHDGSSYLRRWWVIPRNKYMNIYLHNTVQDDDDRALHDHPWPSCSIILKGGYYEHVFDHPDIIPVHKGGERPTRKIWRRPGSIIFRKAESAHRLELRKNGPTIGTWLFYADDGMPWERPCWSLFITGPWQRTWGFHCKSGWKSWREFLGVPAGQEHRGQTGPGCGEA